MINTSIQIDGQTFYNEEALNRVAEMTKACFDITQSDREYLAWIQRGNTIFNARGTTVWEAVKNVHEKVEKYYE